MANEISISAQLACNNGNFSSLVTPAITVNQTNVGAGGPPAQSIPTSDTLVTGLTGLTTNGYGYIINLDPTNYVTFGPDNGAGAMIVFGKLKPGEFAIVRLAPTVILRAKADTAAVKIQVLVLED